MPVAGHRCAALLDGPMAAVAHETDDRYDHRQHGTGHWEVGWGPWNETWERKKDDVSEKDVVCG